MSEERALFGELRSLFERRPSLRAWYQLAARLEAVEQAAWDEQLGPYVQAQLDRPGWREQARPCPRRWADALDDPLEQARVPPAIALITELTLDRRSVGGVRPKIWEVALCGRPLPALQRLVVIQPEETIREGAGAAEEGFSKPLVNAPTTLETDGLSAYDAIWGLSKLWSPGPDSALSRLIVTRAEVGRLARLLSRYRLEWPRRLRALELRRAGATMEQLHMLVALPQIAALDELGLSPQCAVGPGEPWEQPASLARALFPEGGGPKIT